jgi:hypothetical protein
MASDGAILGQKAITLPSDSSVNRPSPVQGMIRYNTTLNQLEYSTDGATWTQLDAGGTAVALSVALG